MLRPMETTLQPVVVTILGVSAGQCDPKRTWEAATAVLRDRLEHRFGQHVLVRYVELFSEQSFQFPAVLNGIGDERYRLPVVLVGQDVVSSGEKLNEKLIAGQIRQRLQEIPD
jgi:disulfide oxidoreductase YuzD